jgi:cytoskeletal protein CcmA (bactofilin family)
MNGDLTITGSLDVIGNVDVSGSLDVIGNVDVSGSLDVIGNVDVNGSLDVIGNVDVSGSLDVSGKVGMGGAVSTEQLKVYGDVKITGNIDVDGSFNFKDIIQTTINNNVILSSQLDISNQGTGPALKVSQLGAGDIHDVALFNAGTEGDAFKIDSSGNSHFYKDVDIGGQIITDGQITNGGFDFRLGTYDQVSRGNSGSSRALVKSTNNILSINHQSDFTGGTQIFGKVGIGISPGTEQLKVNGTAYITGNTVVDGIMTTGNPILVLNPAFITATSNSNGEVPWTAVIDNYNSFNTTTRRYTIPISGYYIFGGQITVNENVPHNSIFGQAIHSNQKTTKTSDWFARSTTHMKYYSAGTVLSPAGTTAGISVLGTGWSHAFGYMITT